MRMQPSIAVSMLALVGCSTAATAMPTIAEVEQAKFCCEIEGRCLVEEVPELAPQVRKLSCENASILNRLLTCTFERRFVESAPSPFGTYAVAFDWEGLIASVSRVETEWCFDQVKRS